MVDESLMVKGMIMSIRVPVTGDEYGYVLISY